MPATAIDVTPHPDLTADGIVAVAAATRDAWRAIALSTEAVDRQATEETVLRLYAESLPDSAPPEIIWCRSPLEAARLVAADAERLGAPARDRVRDLTWSVGRARLAERLGPREFGRVWQAACGDLAPLISTLIARIATAVEEHADPEDIAERTALRIALTHAVHGQFDASWLPLYEASGMACGLGRMARSAGWWWPFENAVILTERPLALRLDDQDRLHHGDGPALVYADGFAVYSWRGTPLTEEFGRRLAATSPDTIRAEENAELRRIMVEHYTPERFLKESGAQPVQEDEAGKLWRIAMGDDESIVLVEVVNSSPEPDGTFNVYFLRVPPSMLTAKAGVAWTFGLTEDEYQPLRQT
ncbi:conserved hypothetical protein [Catenulispora acidiphila DSM 44928]|uniref:DUF6745 domain-containing protein n=1 Tax=Catenulispora acidiphila (strain DSM 44928 / JCM 14897 / NBRC 102108 / NRRL B-24433 / ID139908) TaxID=479433 RepID=C7Q603_CATAD|nr:hypothetical protein [Catenulispora acidiphila]ACU70100.1 conserved hypothetical protein [Catenulispora acidiphila DSM 44928]